MKEIIVRPDASILMESTRSIGYSLEAAIADLIDNSISALANEIDIYFIPTEEPYIAVLDNGIGMSDLQVNNAMKYGSQNPGKQREQNDLGRFGLGLKTASLSQCKILTVVSKQQGRIVARRWDLDHVKNTQDWTLIELEEPEIMKLPRIQELLEKEHGTLVLWQKLDRLLKEEIEAQILLSAKMQQVKQHIALVFHRYIEGEDRQNKIVIRANKDTIQALDPYLKEKSMQLMDEEIILIKDKKIIVKPYILPHPSKMTAKELKELGGTDKLKSTQGFYIYRNKRLIVWGTWFRLMPLNDLSKLARVMVDIPNSLDELWTLDIKKSEAVPPKQVKENLARLVEKITQGSKRTWSVRSRKENNDDIKQVWKVWKDDQEQKYYEINRDYPILEEINELLDSQGKKKLEMVLKLIQDNIPLNTLRMDINNDAKISIEDSKEKDAYIITMIKEILKDSHNKEETKEELKITQPFCEYKEVIESIDTRGGIYEQ